MRLHLPGLLLGLLLTGAASAASADAGSAEWSERSSLHFVLHQDVGLDRYTGWNGSRRFERNVLDALESAYDELRRTLGTVPRHPVRVVVWESELFDRQFDGLFRFRAAGFYDGTIHVRGAEQVSAELTATLHHELVHASIDASGATELPGWLNEGIAEYFERRALGRRLPSRAEHAALRAALGEGRWIPLTGLGAPGFGALDETAAPLAYLESYAAVELLARLEGAESLGRLLDRIASTNSVERALQRTYRLEQAELEQKLKAELR